MYGCTKGQIKDITGFKKLNSSNAYLGNSFILGRAKAREFGRIKEWVKAKLKGWKHGLLSKVSKATLIKVVIQAIPSYTMATFLVPKSICQELDSLACRFC